MAFDLTHIPLPDQQFCAACCFCHAARDRFCHGCPTPCPAVATNVSSTVNLLLLFVPCFPMLSVPRRAFHWCAASPALAPATASLTRPYPAFLATAASLLPVLSFSAADAAAHRSARRGLGLNGTTMPKHNCIEGGTGKNAGVQARAEIRGS